MGKPRGVGKCLPHGDCDKGVGAGREERGKYFSLPLLASCCYKLKEASLLDLKG